MKKRSNRRLRALQVRIIDLLLILRGRCTDYTFNADRYPESFVSLTQQPSTAGLLPLPQRITLFWLGGTPMSSNRIRGLSSVRRLNPNLDVQLVTDDEIQSILVPGFPLHPAYHNLALTHRSDYLRCYVMHFYGGGYCDVKELRRSWEPAFQHLSSGHDSWVLGYRELGHTTTTDLSGAVQRETRNNFFRIVGNSGFIMRPQTPLTTEWFVEIHRRLDRWQAQIAEFPGGIHGGEEGDQYPVPKHELLSDILAPLALKYHKHLIIDDSIRPIFENYR